MGVGVKGNWGLSVGMCLEQYMHETIIRVL